MLRSVKNPSPTIPCADEASEPAESANSSEVTTTHESCEDVVDEQSTEMLPGKPRKVSADHKHGGGDDAETAGPIITDTMVELEKKMEEQSVKEDAALQEERKKAMINENSEKRALHHQRLRFLLTRSQAYSKYLSSRIDSQKHILADMSNECQKKAREEGEVAEKKTSPLNNIASESEPSELKKSSDDEPTKENEGDQSPKVSTRRSLRSRMTVEDAATDKDKDLSSTGATSPRVLKSVGTISNSQSSNESEGQNDERSGRQTRRSVRLSRGQTDEKEAIGSLSNSKQTGQPRRGRKRKDKQCDITEIFQEALDRNKKQKLEEQIENNTDSTPKDAISNPKVNNSSPIGANSTLNDKNSTSMDINSTTKDTKSTRKDTDFTSNDTIVETHNTTSKASSRASTVTTATDTTASDAAAAASYDDLTSEQTETSYLTDNESTGAESMSKCNEMRRMINGEEVDPSQPILLTGGVLRPYQIEGFKWLQLLYENGVNGILADEMGLGKTIQCIASIADLVNRGVPGPFLICAPLSTIPNWVAEFNRFAPKVPVILYHGTKDERARLRRRIHRMHKVRPGVAVQPVVVTSFEVTMNDRVPLSHHVWKYVIVDEGHRIKNCRCRLVKELKMYKSTHKLLLTGTPLQNNLTELWSLLHFLLPEIFDQLSSFQDFLNVAYLETLDGHEELIREEEQNNVLSMLHEMLSPFILRRLKSDVEIHIPPKREVLVYAPLSELQEEQYRSILNRSIEGLMNRNKDRQEEVEHDKHGRPVRRSRSNVSYEAMFQTEDEISSGCDEGFDDWLEKEQEEEEEDKKTPAVSRPAATVASSHVRLQMRNMMMLLRKCCNHPYLIEHPIDGSTGQLCIDSRLVAASGKLMLLDRMLGELKRRGHKVLIFSQMTTILDLIEDYCHFRQFRYCRLDGSTRMEDRREQISDFNTNPEVFIFLLSTRAGGLGINLAAADTVIIYDSDWNPQADLQAQDRCHRIGQTRPVLVYRFVTAGTVDEKIVERADAKRKLEKLVMHQGKFKSENFLSHFKPITSEEIMELLSKASYDKVVKGHANGDVSNRVISDSDLEKLLDRSDLCHDGPEKIQDTSTDTASGVAGVYKILDQDDGKMAIGSLK